MTKAEFIDKVADKSGLTKRDAQAAVDAFLDSVTETLGVVHRLWQVLAAAACRAPGGQPADG